MLEPRNTLPSGLPSLRGGRYLIYGVLGKGGNARVYQAWDTQVEAWRAIKVLAPDQVENDEVRARFAQESELMARLDHPHVVRVYDIADDPYTPHIVMELCAGGAIIDWMKVHGAVPPRLALRVMRQIGEAVRMAHEQGLIHRDIKPHNILIDAHGVAKLTDFGIAREIDSSLTQSGSVLGTYAFMAPEQRNDAAAVDHRADIYALGATLFTLVRVKTSSELFIAEPDDPLFEGVPPTLVELILKAASYRPKDRHPDVAAFLAHLDEVEAGLPPDPPDTPPLEALARSLPLRPPDDLPDLEQLEDLLRALALSEELTGSDVEGIDTTLNGGDEEAVEDRPSYLAEPEPEPEPEAPVVIGVEEPEEVPSLEELAAARRRSGLLWLASAMVGAVAVGVAALAVVVGYGAVEVTGARTRVQVAERDLVEAVHDATPIVPELPKERAELLSQLFFQIEDQPDRAPELARRFASVLEEVVAQDRVEGDALLVSQNVLGAADRVRSAERAWSEAASSWSGRFAVLLGLATAPIDRGERGEIPNVPLSP